MVSTTDFDSVNLSSTLSVLTKSVTWHGRLPSNDSLERQTGEIHSRLYAEVADMGDYSPYGNAGGA